MELWRILDSKGFCFFIGILFAWMVVFHRAWVALIAPTILSLIWWYIDVKKIKTELQKERKK